MTQNKLLQRIRVVIDRKCGGSETAFAKQIGEIQQTLNRKLKINDDDKLLDLTGRILLTYPDISRHWLLTGEGEMEEQNHLKKLEREMLDVLRENRNLLNENRLLREQLTNEQHDVFPVRVGDARIGNIAAHLSHQDTDQSTKK